jgi:hypothetical protein
MATYLVRAMNCCSGAVGDNEPLFIGVHQTITKAPEPPND